jgi:hypothetical protein
MRPGIWSSWSQPGALAPRDSARIHATYRTLARGLQLAAIRRCSGVRWRTAALAAAAALDVLEWRAIRRSGLSLARRLAIDLADIAFWAGPAKADPTTALTGLVAMDFEAGVAQGPRGLVVPALAGAVASVARSATGQRPDPAQGVPHVGAVIGGMAVRRGERRRLQRALEIHEAELAAKRVRAFLAGQHDVATGASTIIDQLKPVAILLEADDPQSALNQVRAGWRDSLAQQARQHAVFLDSAVRLWQQRHNDHPDLDGYVDAAVAEGDGTTLLTGHQARALADLLEARALRGRMNIKVLRGTSIGTRPGRAFSLLVNDEVVEVPADPDATVDRFNPAPPAFFFGAWAALMPARATDGALPMSQALACSAAFVAAGLASLGRSQETSARSSQFTATLLAGFQGAICLRGCSVRRDQFGRHLFQGTYGIAPAGILLAANRQYLSARERRAGIGSLMVVACLAYVLADRPRSLIDLAVALGHPAAAMIGMDVVARAAARETKRLASELREQDEQVEAVAFAAGRGQVLALAQAALEEANCAFEAKKDLDADVRESLSARLASIRELATALASSVDPG